MVTGPALDFLPLTLSYDQSLPVPLLQGVRTGVGKGQRKGKPSPRMTSKSQELSESGSLMPRGRASHWLDLRAQGLESVHCYQRLTSIAHVAMLFLPQLG